MNATLLPSRRKAARNHRQTPASLVKETLLEIAYLLHASKVVSRPRAPQRRERDNCERKVESRDSHSNLSS
jgi:hypothetical protein